MRVDVSQYIGNIRKGRKLRHRVAAFLTAMSMAVSMTVFWQLRSVGTAMEPQGTCTKQEHTHTDECYETVLVCGHDTDSSAQDTDSVSEKYDCVAEKVQDVSENAESAAQGENDVSEGADSVSESTAESVDKAEQSVDSTAESAQSTPEKADSDAQSADSSSEKKSSGHVHTDKCYEKRLICGLEEHTHSSECTSDMTADTETQEVWEKTLPSKLTKDIRTNIALVAQSQLGYSESKTNFHFSEDGETKNGYTRYGQWYGSPYGEWNSLFTYFCMYYAGVDRQNVPYGSGIAAWTAELGKKDLLVDIKDAKLQKGDVVIIDSDLDSKPDRCAVVSQVSEKDGKTVVKTIEGDVEGKVANGSYILADKHILNCVDLENASGDVVFENSSASGVKVTARAEKGTFPEKTTMTVKDISKSEAVKTAEAALGKDRTIEDAVAVDITFKDAKGKKIEPADSKNVQVQIKLPDKIKFDKGEYSLLHVIDKDNVQQIENANLTASGAEFESESFSIFVLTRDVGYVEPSRLVMIGGDYGSNSESNPYMIYVGERITLRYTGEYKDSGKFTVFGNDYKIDGVEHHHIGRYNNSTDIKPAGENYVQAEFEGLEAGKCRIVYLDDGTWGEDHVSGDLWVQVVDPIYVKTYYGDKGKDYIKEYLGGYSWIKDKNGYIQNTSGKPYILRVGDVISVRSNAAGSFEMQDSASTYLQALGEQDGYTLYKAIAPTPDNSPAEIQHKNGDTVNDRLYVRVMPTTNGGYTHCDMEIADDGKYTLTEFTENGKTEKVYKAYVTKINSDTILRDANGDEVNRMPVDAYRKLGEPGQTQYEMTSAYYVERYGYVGDPNLLHFNEYKVYAQITTDGTTDPPTKEWVEWHLNDPLEGDLYFDKQSHTQYRFDPNKVKSVDFNVQITLYPDKEIVYEKDGDNYTEKSRKSIAQEDPQVIENTQVHFEGQPLIDAMNKCPLDNGLDFTYQPAGALVKLQAGKKLTNIGANAREGQFNFELCSDEFASKKVVNDGKVAVSSLFTNIEDTDKIKAYKLFNHNNTGNGGGNNSYCTEVFDMEKLYKMYPQYKNDFGFVKLIDRINKVGTSEPPSGGDISTEEYYSSLLKCANPEKAILPDANGDFNLDAGHYFFVKESVVGAARNDAKGKVTFPYLAFSEQDKGKTFTYYMSEVPDPGNSNVEKYDRTVHEVKITIGQDMSVTVKYDNGDTHPTFSNTLKEYTLPNTGGCGVIPHICIGTGLISGAGILLWRKKRRESE